MARNGSQPAAYSSFMVGVLVAREVGACSERLTAPKQNPAAGVTVAGLWCSEREGIGLPSSEPVHRYCDSSLPNRRFDSRLSVRMNPGIVRLLFKRLARRHDPYEFRRARPGTGHPTADAQFYRCWGPAGRD